tara:strand:- start:91681 stop:93579 length:1899 start_codon:yes stop_codon:yes gene_type:complete
MNRISELEKLIKHHKSLYYSGRPEISDTKYDAYEDELRALDPENKTLELIGSKVSSSDKVKHDSKMLSLNKTYKIEDLISWIGDKKVISTYKIDGVSCSIIYDKRKIEIAKTRGDGTFGENITSKVIWLDSVPGMVDIENRIEVRGELYCTEESFFKLSDEMTARGLEKPTSQRNIVAGLIGRKSDGDLCKYLTFKAFDLITEKLEFKTEMEKKEKLRSLNFDTPSLELHKDRKSIERVLEETKEFMAEGDYQIDGIVFSYNELSLHEELGSTAHHPRYKMAFKFQGESKETVINEIVWNVSRNGTLTPVGNVKPVDLSGAKISRVTLHNYGLVKQYNLKKGDLIEIVRSGEVIPKFIQVIKESDNDFEIPMECPSCGEKIKVVDIRLKCENGECPAQIKEEILNFVVKIGIDDISSKRIDEMLSKKIIKRIPDLYRKTKADFMSLDKVKDKLADKFVEAINNSKNVDITTFLSALGISGGAYNKCEKVVNSGIDTIEKVQSLTKDQLLSIEGFAEKSAIEYLKSLKDKKELIEELESVGFSFKKKNITETMLTKKKVCITGSLSMKRNDIEKILRDAGAIMVSSVTKNTDYLLTNDTESNSSKFKKAQALSIPIINEKKLMELLGEPFEET